MADGHDPDMPRATFKSFVDSTKEEWQMIASNAAEFNKGLADRVLAHLRLLDGDFGGFPVDRLEHSLQTATRAMRAGEDEEYVVCALLHDIGHYTNEFGADAAALGVDNHHDEAGAAVIAPYFPSVVTDCVRAHVAAKRYLCAVDADYFGRLSQASVDTLKLQGGPMGEKEVAAFQQGENLDAIIQVRIWDDQGKDPDMKTPPFAHYAPVLQRVVERHCGSPA